METKPLHLESFVAMASTWNVAEQTAKELFHDWGKKTLELLAKSMKLPKGSYDIRSNLGGVAVSGEVTLHGESIYVQFSQSNKSEKSFLVRQCKGRQDYTGGRNHWVHWAELLNMPNLAKKLKNIATPAEVLPFGVRRLEGHDNARYVVDIKDLF